MGKGRERAELSREKGVRRLWETGWGWDTRVSGYSRVWDEWNGGGGRVSRYICVYVLFLVLSRNAFSLFLFLCFSCVHVMEKGYPETLGSLSLSLARPWSVTGTGNDDASLGLCCMLEALAWYLGSVTSKAAVPLTGELSWQHGVKTHVFEACTWLTFFRHATRPSQGTNLCPGGRSPSQSTSQLTSWPDQTSYTNHVDQSYPVITHGYPGNMLNCWTFWISSHVPHSGTKI